MSWYLDNVYELNKQAPYTFYFPSSEVLEKVKVGYLVKLIFITKSEEEDGFNGERMWVEITEINKGGFVGKLDNEPYCLPLKIGDEILFGVENIYDTEYEDPVLYNWNYYFDTKVTVSIDVLERREFNFLLRDNPSVEGDSGWSILSGYEDDEYLCEPENFDFISLGVILNIDDSILELLGELSLCAYERNDKDEYCKIMIGLLI